MPAIVYKAFSGEIPNSEPHLLAPERAQLATNCEFTGGGLRPMKDGFLLQAMQNNPVRGIYTEDGINFYTWNAETQAFKGPVIDDIHHRMYYLTPSEGVFSVAPRPLNASNGPSPSTHWTVGIPRPSYAPTLTLINRDRLVDYPNAYVQIECWYEYGGKQYGLMKVNHSVLIPFKKFSFAPPSFVSDSYPSGSVLAAKIRFRDADDEDADICSAVVRIGASAKSSGLPGGVEFNLTGGTGSPYPTTLTIEATWGVMETRAYVYTYVNTWSEEGAPSPAAVISPTYLDDVQISVTTDEFSAAGVSGGPATTSYKPFQKINLYRTYGTGTTYLQTQYIGMQPKMVDASTRSSAVGKALESIDWTPPPSGLQGAVLMPNGWFAAFKGNMLYLSEPFRPHAWPYSQSFPVNIRGIAVAQQSLVVTTADGVHIVTGAHPASAQAIRLSIPQAGYSQRSMTQVDGGVAYAANDGIVLVSGNDASIQMSQKLFARTKWRERYGSSLDDMIFAWHDGCLVATSKSTGQGFTIRFDEDTGAFSRVSVGYDALFQLPVTDSLYFASGANVYQFKGGNDMAYDWWGRDWVFPSHCTFGAGYIRSSGDVTLRLYADGALVHTGSIASGHFRLPPLPRALRWSVRFSGSAAVSEFAMASSMSELKSV